ncbi:hypothetical protein F5883DRAFT_588450 [Diaporthe sp. PMI_573]|nr:hypothetical protein F5883DRAFT_588450 [Diaporthaceae sp. PMI_573]
MKYKTPLTLSLPQAGTPRSTCLTASGDRPLYIFVRLRMDLPPRSLPDLAPAYPRQLEPLHTVHHNALPTQQLYGSVGVDQTAAFTLQVQLSGGQVATMQNHAPHPFNLYTAHPSHARFDIGFAGNSQSASASAPTAPAGAPSIMDPPRKRKAPTLYANDWEPYKERILDLHIVQKLPLPKVREMIEEEYGFKAELRQYRTRISQWGKDRNVKPQEMEAIVRKRQKRKLVETDKRPLVFEVRGGQVEPQKIERWMKRHDVAESFLYAPSPAASTPSAVGCHTISERGSPATVSVYRPVASVSSPGGTYLAAQSPQMPSPALSVSSIVRPQASAFAWQSPTVVHGFLVELQAASRGGQEAVVKMLLEAGADPNAQGGHYGNALQAASTGGHEAVVKILLDEGALDSGVWGQTPLLWAAGRGHEAVVRLLLDRGADPEAKGRYGQTPLSNAAGRGHEAVVQLLKSIQ